MSPLRVLVIGGYGFFGRRLVERLSRRADLELLVAGRRIEEGRSLVAQLAPGAQAILSAVPFDSHGPSLEDAVRRVAPAVAIDLAGPFQGQPPRVPTACIAAGVHYVDLADDRAFVCDISRLNRAAQQAGVAVISGASSVPALSGAAADRLAQGLDTVTSIDIGISPGNRTERGLATVSAILHGCGRQLPGGDKPRFAWSGGWRHDYPAPVGRRLLSPCDVPDLALLPSRYAGEPKIRFGAGLELVPLHRGINLMAWLTRRGVVRDWSRHARMLKATADLLCYAGSDAGAMHVTLSGRDARGKAVERAWHLVATGGDGPYVPTLAAAALLTKVQRGLVAPGARPCLGLLNLDDIAAQCDGLAIRMELSG